MSSFSTDRLMGRVIQMAFVVPDIEQAMDDFTRQLKIGPWFYFERLPAIEQIHRGRPVQLDLAVALGYGASGQTMFELIEQRDRTPSVYRETIETRGHGFHHYGIGTDRFDADIHQHQQQGYELVFSARTPRGNRGAYMQAPASLGGLVEYIELTKASQDFYSLMYAASLSFTGADPVRRLA